MRPEIPELLDALDEFSDALGAVRPEIHFVKLSEFLDALAEFLDALGAVCPKIHFVKLSEFLDALAMNFLMRRRTRVLQN